MKTLVKRGLVASILALLGNSASADWTSIGTSAGITFYVGLGTIRKAATTSRIWTMIDFPGEQTDRTGNRFASAKIQREFDCSEERSRILALMEYLGSMESGNVIFTSTSISAWNPVSPQSIDREIWKLACN